MYAEWCPLCADLSEIYEKVAQNLCSAGIMVGEADVYFAKNLLQEKEMNKIIWL